MLEEQRVRWREDVDAGFRKQNVSSPDGKNPCLVHRRQFVFVQGRRWQRWAVDKNTDDISVAEVLQLPRTKTEKRKKE